LARALGERGVRVQVQPDGALVAEGWAAAQVGDLAAANGWAIHELTPQTTTLEEAYLMATRGAVEFQSGGAGPASSSLPGAAAPPPAQAQPWPGNPNSAGGAL
jgi:ABC-2 type transport system ATP-binding protein